MSSPHVYHPMNSSASMGGMTMKKADKSLGWTGRDWGRLALVLATILILIIDVVMRYNVGESSEAQAKTIISTIFLNNLYTVGIMATLLLHLV